MVIPVLTYASEIWSLTNAIVHKLVNSKSYGKRTTWLREQRKIGFIVYYYISMYPSIPTKIEDILISYNAYTTPEIGTNKDLGTLVRTTIPTTRLHNPIPCGNNVETLEVTVTLLNQKLDIHNIYRKMNREESGELQLTQLFALAEGTPSLICGDFNAHHPISSPSTTNPSGEHIAFALGEFEGVSLLNTGHPTHIRGGRLDLTSATTAIRHLTRWRVHSTLVSDPFATVTELEIQQLPPRPPPPPRWNQDLAD
ncbi:uncharacterized protein [Palaemon carinicauda]|uniref:uncharacterized protein n=1 Tax=Palaemon carinicauda TaxID=392227 RepID=UPI0035B5F560